uniref:Thioredoxin domain-containing protein n=1 Tax=Bionectria ochroleuca TaxID=29856 RepID=A0A8H7TNV9_BIOOC
MSEGPISISSAEQFNSLLKSSKIVVADFYADWCGPCKQIAPLYEQLAKSLSRPNAVTFVKINNDEQTEISKEYSVTALPTFLVFKNGKLEDTVKGRTPNSCPRLSASLFRKPDLAARRGAGPRFLEATATSQIRLSAGTLSF